MRGRDTKLTVLRFDETARTPLNTPSGVWVEYMQVWGSKMDASDRESVGAAQQATARTSVFHIDSSARARTISAADRLQVSAQGGGGVWQIISVCEAEAGRLRTLEITAVRQSDEGSP